MIFVVALHLGDRSAYPEDKPMLPRFLLPPDRQYSTPNSAGTSCVFLQALLQQFHHGVELPIGREFMHVYRTIFG